MNKLVDARVMVVGGSSGMGLAVARAAADAGAHVSIVARDPARLSAAARQVGTSVATHSLDVTDERAIQAFFAQGAPIDHLIITSHAASVVTGALGSLSEMTVAAARAFMETKFWGPFMVAKYAAPRLAERGSMTLFSGAAGVRKPLPNHTAIGATNGAVEAFARQLSREIAPRRVNVVAPGLVRTPAYDAVPEAAREAMYANYGKSALVGRVGEPQDIAGAVMYLLTNSFVTGTVLEIDGGRP